MKIVSSLVIIVGIIGMKIFVGLMCRVFVVWVVGLF